MHDDTTYKFLYPEITTRTQTLYLLPKVHKPDIPGRPIISGCGGPTVKLSQCPDHILTRIFSLNSNLPNNIILVTIEVKSLYTNIPNDEGIRACIDMLKWRHWTWQPHKGNHNRNALTNTDKKILIHGTAMGSPMAPIYANIFKAVPEKQMLLNAPIEWIRFIADIFCIMDPWNWNTTQIFRLHQHIAFDNKIWLYILFYINNHNQFQSDLHIKPTDRTLLLHNDSFHPTSCKNSIILSQALGYRCLINDNKWLQQRLDHLCVILINRGYKQSTINTTFEQAKQNTQIELLHQQKQPHIFCSMQQHHHIIQQDPTLSILWPEAPIVAYKKKKILKDSCTCQITNTNIITDKQLTHDNPPNNLPVI